MAETLVHDSTASTELQYDQLLTQLQALCHGEDDLTANLANIAAAMRQTFNFFWVGFYIVKDQQLVLGPFQGDIACTRIAYGKGVCGTAWQSKSVQWVPDVDAFDGHIVCSSASRSEVVAPIIKEDKVVAVLDIDSDKLDDFTAQDVAGIQQLSEWVATLF